MTRIKAPVVYRFICPDPDGRSYVGSVSNGRKRPDIGIARSNSRLEEAFAQYPPEAWTYEVLEQLPSDCSRQARLEAEQHHIDRLQTWSPEFGFNIEPAIWTGDGPAQRAGRQYRASINKTVPKNCIPPSQRPDISLPDGEVLQPRVNFAASMGDSEKTITRLKLPTTYVGNVAYVLRQASLKIIGDKAERPNQPR
jgi:hypothetical protein